MDLKYAAGQTGSTGNLPTYRTADYSPHPFSHPTGGAKEKQYGGETVTPTPEVSSTLCLGDGTDLITHTHHSFRASEKLPNFPGNCLGPHLFQRLRAKTIYPSLYNFIKAIPLAPE
ncbi:hypothetical protein [Aliiroseovarius crassostreae]|uniref:hypothetical protein n=1 Tax=Aliiroseovarius crassostreae TaxID=154981 RepID=UPI00220357EC|nr:hypothetical protein [Aliiroseovarius crassostreae]UWP98886.1 hypothetical protein K3X53_01560 [Aliiroseovarius crassostreae]